MKILSKDKDCNRLYDTLTGKLLKVFYIYDELKEYYLEGGTDEEEINEF